MEKKNKMLLTSGIAIVIFIFSFIAAVWNESIINNRNNEISSEIIENNEKVNIAKIEIGYISLERIISIQKDSEAILSDNKLTDFQGHMIRVHSYNDIEKRHVSEIEIDSNIVSVDDCDIVMIDKIAYFLNFHAYGNSTVHTEIIPIMYAPAIARIRVYGRETEKIPTQELTSEYIRITVKVDSLYSEVKGRYSGIKEIVIKIPSDELESLDKQYENNCYYNAIHDVNTVVAIILGDKVFCILTLSLYLNVEDETCNIYLWDEFQFSIPYELVSR